MRRFYLLWTFLFYITFTVACPMGVNSATLPSSTNVVDLEDDKDIKAFPGALGFGTNTPGGRGGRVIYVTNLDDSGPGSLRDALTATGRRMVLFSVSGTIDLKDNITIFSPYLTVAGQTAPGEGVQIRGGHIRIATHDVIIRYLKIRSGDDGGRSENADRDAITVNQEKQAYNIVIDHCTLIWGPDIGGLSFLNDAHDATVSYSIMGEGLYVSKHPEANARSSGHSMSMNITELDSKRFPSRITVHHNLLTTSADRNPRVIGGENIDIVNNVIYNWRYSPSQGNPRSLNLINNYYIPGPMTDIPEALAGWIPKVEAGGSLRKGAVYESGNLAVGFTEIRGRPQSVYASEPFTPYSMPDEDSPQKAYIKVVGRVGANLQVADTDGSFKTRRDIIDRRIIFNLVGRSGAFLNGEKTDGTSNFSVITWPDLNSGPAALDKDQDGMPDEWERMYFDNTQRQGAPDDSSSDWDRDGYTDLEEYLNQTDPTKKESLKK